MVVIVFDDFGFLVGGGEEVLYLQEDEVVDGLLFCRAWNVLAGE
jgi:hypothetical protein